MAAKRKSIAEFRAALQAYLFELEKGKKSVNAGNELKSDRKRLESSLLKVLADPALRERLTASLDDSPLADSPIGRACDLFRYVGPPPPAEFIPELARFLDDEDDQVRGDVAHLIAKIGTAASIPHVRRALGDDNASVRFQAVTGLERGPDDVPLDRRIRAKLFDDVLACVRVDFSAINATELLLTWDRDRAVPILTSSDMLSGTNPGLIGLLPALMKGKVAVPRGQLLRLLRTVERRDLSKYRTANLLGYSLKYLARHRQKADLARLEKYAEHNDETVARHGLEALLIWHDLERFDERIDSQKATQGIMTLPAEQRCYRLASDVHYWGLYGFAEYFTQEDGEHWREAAESLEKVGLKGQAKLVRQAAAKFGRTGPVADQGRRIDQLKDLKAADENVFVAIDAKYQKLGMNIDMPLLRYVLEHREAFR